MFLKRPESQNSTASPAIGSRQTWLAGLVAFALIAGSVAVTPFANIEMAPLPAYPGMTVAAMVIISLFLAILLLMQGSVDDQSGTVQLGSAYLFTAAILACQIACYPSLFIRTRFIGVPASSFWIWVFWHAGFSIMILRYAWIAGNHRLPKPRCLWQLAFHLA